jgi:hypothetical protein
MIDTEITTIPLKEDGSLDVMRISCLPLDIFTKVVEDLTQEQWKEFSAKCKPYTVTATGPIEPIVVDYPIEEDGVDALEFLNKMRRSVK